MKEAVQFDTKNDILPIAKETLHFIKICDILAPDVPLELKLLHAAEPDQKKCKPVIREVTCAETLPEQQDDVRLSDADCKCVTMLFSLLKTIPKQWGSSLTTNATKFECPQTEEEE